MSTIAFWMDSSGYFQIPIDPLDQEKTTFTCPYGTFSYRRMPFGLLSMHRGRNVQKVHGLHLSRLLIEKHGRVFAVFSVGRISTTIYSARDFQNRPASYEPTLKKETPFIFSKECIEAFETLKMKLTQAPILVASDWDLPFEIICDASDFAIGAVLGQRKTKPPSKPDTLCKQNMTSASHYSTNGKELLAIVYALGEIRPILSCPKA
ncbi:DNA-directed DNA polymerase [Tanacetum coccineum]